MSKTKNYIAGLGVSILTGFAAIGIGILLSLTIIGAIVGVPMVLVGILQIVLSPFTGALFIMKKCPYCGRGLLITRWQRSLKCGKCKSRLIIRDKQLEVVNAENGPSRGASAADELAKLSKLKDQGVISQAEFDAKKKQLLSS